MWPTFAVLTAAEGFLMHELPPTGTRIPDVVIGSILALFGNIFLVGVVAPWLARRLIERDRHGGGRERFPPEVYLDRTATTLLVVGLAGVLAAGLGNRRVTVSETKATEEAGSRARTFVDAHADPEIKRNIDFANSARLGDSFFRVCVPRDNATKQWCMFIDTREDTVAKDPSTLPNKDFARPGR